MEDDKQVKKLPISLGEALDQFVNDKQLSPCCRLRCIGSLMNTNEMNGSDPGQQPAIGMLKLYALSTVRTT